MYYTLCIRVFVQDNIHNVYTGRIVQIPFSITGSSLVYTAHCILEYKLKIVLFTLFVRSWPAKLTGLYRTVSTFVLCSSEFTRLVWTKMACSRIVYLDAITFLRRRARTIDIAARPVQPFSWTDPNLWPVLDISFAELVRRVDHDVDVLYRPSLVMYAARLTKWTEFCLLSL